MVVKKKSLKKSCIANFQASSNDTEKKTHPEIQTHINYGNYGIFDWYSFALNKGIEPIWCDYHLGLPQIQPWHQPQVGWGFLKAHAKPTEKIGPMAETHQKIHHLKNRWHYVWAQSRGHYYKTFNLLELNQPILMRYSSELLLLQ